MINIEDRFFSLNRALLLAVGLWPYKKSKLALLYLICCFSCIISLVIFQLTTFVTSKCTTDHIIKILSSVFACMTIIVKYNSFCVNAETVKYLLEQLQRIWNDLKDSKEIAIIEKYGNNGKRYTTAFTIIAASSVSLITIVQLGPDICHSILSVNKSRSQRLQTLIMNEYFVDQEKHFYLLLLHQNLTIGLGLFALAATGTMLFAYLQHACGIFQLARFSTHLISNFEMSFMFMIIFGVLSLSLNIYRIISLNFRAEELLIPLMIATICVLYMFIANLVGQEITNHCNNVFVTAYEVQWYIIPLHTQKLILFLLQRSSKTFGLHVGGLFVASLECFTTLTNASVSYFTVLYSMR